MAKPIISFAIILLSLGFALFYVMPAYDFNVARRGDIVSLDKILNTSSEIQNLIEKTKENLNSIDPEVLNRFEVFLPKSIDPIRFANNIQHIGLKNRIILSGISVQGSSVTDQSQGVVEMLGGAVSSLAKTLSLGSKIDIAEAATPQSSPLVTNSGKKYVSTAASFSFTTTQETFQLFLNDLERSLGLINVTALSFAPAGNGVDDSVSSVSPEPTYQYSMAIETYSLQ